MSLRAHFTLDPDVVFLNHGSYGACPRAVLEEQTRLRAELEREPVRFMNDMLEGLLSEARTAAAAFVRAKPACFAFVRNSTTGVNAVLRSLDFRPGDELLTTDHAYESCRSALEYVASRTSSTVRVAKIPLPVSDPAEVTGRILSAVTPRTRIALVDHVTSQTGLVFPIADIVRELDARGVDTLVDGAHAPGMVDLDVDAIGAAYYAGNFHKWVSAPKGAAMLVVREDRQAGIHPLTISRGHVSSRSRPRFLEEFDWTGTDDPTPWLCVKTAILHIGEIGGGWEAVRRGNREKVLAARRLLEDALGSASLAPESMIGSLAAVALPDARAGAPDLGRALYERHRVQVPVFSFPAPPARLLRISAHVHNEAADYEALVAALRDLGVTSG